MVLYEKTKQDVIRTNNMRLITKSFALKTKIKCNFAKIKNNTKVKNILKKFFSYVKMQLIILKKMKG